ncbi:hypothetical protein HELRODRAFT_63585, partial [Helobdella robusta]|uniref:Protein lin-52 homolog n=1 Tax=Helobdella robusta TaxID=6412 RepID=T1FXH7_HELRO
DLDQSLMSFERMDRTSPDLWPEQIPGVSDYSDLLVSITPEPSPPKWLDEVEKVDHDMLQEFSSLTTSQLIEKVKDLHQLAFQLGLDEAHEMVRGKFLNILARTQKKI